MAKKKQSKSPADAHQKKVLIDTLKMSDIGASIMGGPTKEYARETLKTRYGMTDKQIAALEE